jgi:urea carboxylase-associated protein 2
MEIAFVPLPPERVPEAAPNTATTSGAREHARAQAGTRVATQPTMPARNAHDLPTGVSPDRVLWDETLGAGGYCTNVLPRGARLRIVDVDGDACAGLAVLSAANPAERLNGADTVKVQWNAYLGRGDLLLSDMGRVLMTIVEDASGRHDALCGTSTARSNAARYGDGSVYGPTPSGRDRFLLALAKHGLGKRDLADTLNLFKAVRVEPDGALTFDGAPAAPGDAVTLRAEMSVIVAIAAVPHRLDPRPTYTCGNIRVTAWRDAPAADDDPFRNATPEGLRAFENTEALIASTEARV